MIKNKTENLEEKNTVEPIGEQRLPSTNNFKKRHLEEFAKEAKARNVPRIDLMDEAFDDHFRKVNDTADIDRMDAETHGYWIERDLEVVKRILPIEICKTMPPYKKAYLYSKLRDATDRKRTFEALGLTKDWEELNLTASILDKAANRNKDGTIANYSLLQVANEIRIELSQIQIEHLQIVLGQKSVEAIRERAKGKFPELQLDEEKSFSEKTMNPALDTVLAVTGLSKEAWTPLPDSEKQKIHDAVRDGKLDLVKKIVSGIAKVAPLVALF